MKGFYIFEEEFSKGVVDCLEIGYIDNTFTHQISNGTLSEEVKMHALVSSKGTKTKCSPDDTYDFETGALIALMKMCGLEKSAKAYAEIFDDTAYGDALMERDKLKEENENLIKKYDLVTAGYDYWKEKYKKEAKKLEDRNKYLLEDINKKLGYLKEKDEEIEKLKSDKDKSWKNYQRNIQKKQDRINQLEAQVKASEDDKQKNIEYYEKEIKDLKKNIDELFESDKYSKSLVGRLSFEKHRLEEEKEKLQHEYNLCLNSENALKYTVDSLNKSVDKLSHAIDNYKNDLYNTAKRCKELSEENEKLKLDCEKLQHGYNDMMFCGGRACGKQYKALVELFKKTDQKKVDAAYKEAYNTTLPVWQKEALRQAYEIRTESKEKPELPRTLDINGTVYRKSIQLKDFGEQINKLTVDSLIEQSRAFTRKCVDEWLYKIPTKREKMWDRIFKLHKINNVIIEVKKEDVSTFLQEIENRIPKITWASGDKIFKTKYTIVDIYGELTTHNIMYFRLSIDNKLSYSSDPNIYMYRDLEHVSYLPPMRWDLFKKGRLAVKVNYDNCKEFYEVCEKELSRRPITMFPCMYTVSICKKDGLFEILTMTDQKKTGRRIVDWEDVR